MEIGILQQLDGASKARGCAVIIDVFRAVTVQCHAFGRGAARIYPVSRLEDAAALKAEHPEYLLAGERETKKLPGFDFGNSPFEISQADLNGKTLIHTTSAGTRGIAAAASADEILLGALANAGATAEYIRRSRPPRVSLVCMGYEARRPSDEDTLCAEYIRSLLADEPFNKRAAVEKLRQGEGKRFFIPQNASFAPPEDFYLSTEFDRFPFALKIFYDEDRRAYSYPVAVYQGDTVEIPAAGLL